MSAAVSVRPPAPARWLAFVNAVFQLPVHVTYGAFWALAYEATASLAGGEPWRPSGGSGVRVVSVVALLFYIRLVDERMDLSYDRVHHPGRPLVTGVVTVAEARRAGWLVGSLVVLVNAAVAPWSALVVALLVGYAELLARPGSGFAALRDRPLLHLAVAYPVQLAIGFYLFLSASSGVRPLLAVFVFALAFLHYEFARKTVRLPEPGSRDYSATALGPAGAGIACLVAALAAGGVLALVTRPWNLAGPALLPYAALAFPLAGAVAYLGRGADHWSKTSAALFLLVLYAGLVVSGVRA